MPRRYLTVALVAACCFGADQWSKTWARTHLMEGISQPFIPWFLKLTITTNTGGAFSLARGNNPLLTIFVAGFICAIAFWIIHRHRSACQPMLCERLGMGFLLGGALGNLWDRLSFGRVTDFLDFTFISFPVFNLADVCIDIGLVLIIANSLIQQHKQSLSESASSAPRSKEQKTAPLEEIQ